jgi:hypothetical protein
MVRVFSIIHKIVLFPISVIFAVFAQIGGGRGKTQTLLGRNLNTIYFGGIRA